MYVSGHYILQAEEILLAIRVQAQQLPNICEKLNIIHL